MPVLLPATVGQYLASDGVPKVAIVKGFRKRYDPIILVCQVKDDGAVAMERQYASDLTDG